MSRLASQQFGTVYSADDQCSMIYGQGSYLCRVSHPCLENKCFPEKHIKVGHYSPTSKTPFEWHFTGGPKVAKDCYFGKNEHTVKHVLSGHSKGRPFFNVQYRLMQVKSIAKCSISSILQLFRPLLSYPLSVRSLFCPF